MKVAVIGATGNAGSRITAELQKRGHQVRAIVRARENGRGEADENVNDHCHRGRESEVENFFS